jgi:hypothetical protein
MQLESEIYIKLQNIIWLANCGEENRKDELDFPVKWISTFDEAISSAKANKWTDAKTEAQGDLTGFLAKNHYSSYGGHWNKLAKTSRKKIENEVMPKVTHALERFGGNESLLSIILLDINRIALQQSYKKKYSKVPDFFEKLFRVYEIGHLPCGWEGSLDDWPKGRLISY